MVDHGSSRVESDVSAVFNPFQALRTLLPHHEGEKLSKAAILQQTAEYIYSLEQEKTRLLSQNCQLKRHLAQSQQNPDSPTETTNLEEEQPTAVKRSRVKPEKEPETIVVETATEPEDTCRIIVADNTTIGQETLLVRLWKQSKASPTNSIFVSFAQVPIASSSAPATTTEPEVTTVVKETIGQEARSFIVTTNPTGKNLDSIVEAIKHLEGDHLFAETGKGSSPQVVQERLSEGKKVVTEAGIIIYKN